MEVERLTAQFLNGILDHARCTWSVQFWLASQAQAQTHSLSCELMGSCALDLLSLPLFSISIPGNDLKISLSLVKAGWLPFFELAGNGYSEGS